MSSKRKAQVFHFDLFGKREEKYEFLNQQSIDSIPWTELEVKKPNFFFVFKDFDVYQGYEKGFEITSLFIVYGMGITTGNDSKLISYDKKELTQLYGDEKQIKEIQYRFFDKRFIYYDLKKVERARESLMNHIIDKSNYGLLSLRGVRNNLTSKFGITNRMIDKSVISTLDNGYIFPLYTYSASNIQANIYQSIGRTANLNMEIVQQIADNLGLQFTNEKEQTQGTFAPIDILDYIYAVLHSPTYREKYKEFLKIDFPRVPYPKDPETFWNLVALGRELRQIHLLESPTVNQFITTYPITGNNLVTKPRFESTQSEPPQLTNSPTRELISSSAHQLGTVWINDQQYFDRVPIIAWNFYIGGYQPAQKWLKDRKGRELSFEDILHYQKIIVALFETDRLMKEIDKINFE
jgi:predicted helicase